MASDFRFSNFPSASTTTAVPWGNHTATQTLQKVTSSPLLARFPSCSCCCLASARVFSAQTMDRTDLRRLTLNLLSWIATPIALYYTASWLLEHLDPLKQRNDVARKQSAKTLQRLQNSVKDAHVRLKDITEHETVIMSEVITPDELNVKFEGRLAAPAFSPSLLNALCIVLT